MSNCTSNLSCGRKTLKLCPFSFVLFLFWEKFLLPFRWQKDLHFVFVLQAALIGKAMTRS
jgi:hypothetical protein